MTSMSEQNRGGPAWWGWATSDFMIVLDPVLRQPGTGTRPRPGRGTVPPPSPPLLVLPGLAVVGLAFLPLGGTPQGGQAGREVLVRIRALLSGPQFSSLCSGDRVTALLEACAVMRVTTPR